MLTKGSVLFKNNKETDDNGFMFLGLQYMMPADASCERLDRANYIILRRLDNTHDNHTPMPVYHRISGLLSTTILITNRII
jgi:hypothetical protein